MVQQLAIPAKEDKAFHANYQTSLWAELVQILCKLVIEDFTNK